MTPDLDIDLTDLSRADWIARLDALGDEHGYLERLGSDHLALSVDAGPRLLVTFEGIDEVRARPDRRPVGFEFVERDGWSLLAILGEPDTWFRGDRVYRFFDRLTDDGFFEDFDRVLFWGVHDGAMAAASYSVAAPGATALLIRPIATLDARLAGWDRRFADKRRLDFTSRYGYAPEMLDAAAHAWVCVDPSSRADMIHAAMYRRPNTTILRADMARPRIESALDALDMMQPVVEAAMDGTLTQAAFARLWRARRESQHYLRTLLKRLEDADRTGLAARVCRHGLTTRDAAYFRRKLDVLEPAGAKAKAEGTAAE